MAAYLEFDQVCKFFPGVKALNGVSFSAHAGQVHGLLGENGAGKSTLLKILGGQYKPDGGRLLVNGEERHFTSAKDAIRAGIAIIHQELQYVPELTVAENVLLGRIAAGATDKEVAAALQLSPRTVEMHVGSALKALGCRTRAEAVHCAARLRLL